MFTKPLKFYFQKFQIVLINMELRHQATGDSFGEYKYGENYRIFLVDETCSRYQKLHNSSGKTRILPGVAQYLFSPEESFHIELPEIKYQPVRDVFI